MALDIYWTVLLLLLLIVLLIISRNVAVRFFKKLRATWKASRKGRIPHPNEKSEQTDTLLPDSEAPLPPPPSDHAQKVSSFRLTFLAIYLLVMTPETLAGPYLWSLLRDDKNLPESTVVALFATAYTSAAISALVVGFLADRYGRRKACLVQCVFHSVGCLTAVFGGECLPLLFVGRVFAGVALTLLWTVFESWMVTEWNARGLESEDGGGMSEMFGLMTLWNCACAILGGVLSHCVVSILGSKVWPFGTAIILQAVAVVLILRNMNENFGVRSEENGATCDNSSPDIRERGHLGDARIWALTLVTCCFEGTTFLIVFFWPRVLKSAHNDSHSLQGLPSTEDSGDDDIPYGVISAALMAAMIIGALTFNASSSSKCLALQRSVQTPVWLLLAAVAVAGVSLVSLSVLRGEATQFCMFLVFELANGVYTPSMAYIRGLVVDEKRRTGLYGVMKIPLFVFVILALGITAEDTRSRRFIFASAAVCLLLAVVGLVFGFHETLRNQVRDSSVEISCAYGNVSDDVERNLSVADCVWNEKVEK